MLEVLLFALALLVPQAAEPAALPDTPQGRHLAAYLEAFNTGDQAKYLAMMDDHVDAALLKKRSVEERGKLFQRMRGDFATLKPSKVLKASAEQIQLAIPDKEGTLATFTFDFASAAPFRIAGIAVEIDARAP